MQSKHKDSCEYKIGSRALTGVVLSICICIAWVPASAQTKSIPAASPLPQPRITQSIDSTQTVSIPNSVPHQLRRSVDIGRMEAGARLDHMILLLKSAPEQEAALSALLDQQQDKSSPNYHHWLTPDEFGAQFGVESSDLIKISGWLKQEGFKVEDISRGRRSITFSGTVAGVEKAFNTKMRRYAVGGEQHFSNSTDIAIPVALSSVIGGVHSLHDFIPRPLHSTERSVGAGAAEPQPAYVDTSGNRYVAPGDFAMIYDTLPLLRSGIDGQGQKIAVLGESNAVQVSDPAIIRFRQLFLPNYLADNTEVISAPGGMSCAAAGSLATTEAYLDVEWAGAAAPGATIVYLASTDLVCAAQYVVDHNSASIISVSFGTCELELGSGTYGSILHVWEQSAAEGITVFVSSGDTGSAGCDNQQQFAAIAGYGVNGYASTPFNVAVGGTQFDEGGNAAIYWNPSNFTIKNPLMPYTSALGYIPEKVWNESGIGKSILAGGGGISQCAAKPAWQVGPGVPSSDPVSLPPITNACPAVAEQHRYLPDVSLDAATHEDYVICTPNTTCSSAGGSDLGVTFVGGTSASTPAFAGIQALIDQQYGRQGQAAYVYYQLARGQDPAVCNASKTGGPGPSCIFHDVTVGNNAVPCGSGSRNCPPDTNVLENYVAGASYDLATGLGSVDANNLFNNWKSVTVRSTSLLLQITNPASAVVSPGQSVTFTATLSVPDNAWGPPPMGTVTLSDGTTQLQPVTVVLDSSKTNYEATFVSKLFSTAGDHVITAQYNDVSGYYLGSQSSSATLHVQPPPTLPTITSVTISPSTLASGQSATITVNLSDVAPSGGAVVSLVSDHPGAFPAPASLTILPGQSSGTTAPVIAGTVASPTSVNVTATYNNSTKFAPVAVNPAGTTAVSISLSPSQITVNQGQSVTLTAILSGATGPAPGGSLFFYDTFNGVASLICTESMSPGSSTGQYSAVCSQQFSSSGLHAISVIFDGDAHYGSAISNVANVSVQQQSGGPTLASLTINPPTIVGGVPAQGVITLTGPAPANAIVSLTSSNEHFAQVPNQVQVTQGFNTRAFTFTTSFTSGTAGATITATYNGTTAAAGLTVLPVGISGVTFYPSSVTAGNAAQFTVYLTGPAAAGTSVTLVSSDPSVLQVPGSVQLPTGATSIALTGTTSAVNANTTVVLTATYNLNSGQGSLTVVPAPPVTLNAFTFSPQTVTGGNSVSGTVWLTGSAPAGGANVSISSSSNLVPSITVPVAAGNSSAPFSLATSAVNSVTNVTLTASYGGVSENAILTLVPPLPFLSTLSFQPSTVEGGSTTTMTITLTAPAPLSGAGINLTSSSSFNIAGVPSSLIILPSETSRTITINTSPIGFIAPVFVTASYNGTSLNSVLTVVPPGTPLAPSVISFSPLVVTGGSSSQATVLLTQPAPANGAVLTLSTDSSTVQVPPMINIPPGASSTVFNVTTSSVNRISTATITVSLNGISQSSLLTLKPSNSPPAGAPVPFLGAPLAPLSQTPGLTGSTLTVRGSGFQPDAQILWNGTPLPTTIVNSSQLQATTPNADLNQTAVVTVQNVDATASNSLFDYLTYPRNSLSFANASLSPIGEPLMLAVGDFNRDGKTDLVVANADNGLSVYLGNGDGTFGPELILPAIFPSFAVVGDFNGDGKPDIVTITGFDTSAVRIFAGNGDGTFTLLPDTPLPAFADSVALAAGDLNGDGALDLVVTGINLTQAYVLLGKGDGTFAPPAPVGNVSGLFNLALADLNGDGKLDLILPHSINQSVAVFMGNGDGTFGPQKEYSTNGYTVALVVADFDGDGHPDIAVANQGPVGTPGAGTAVLHNNGDGTFAAPVTYGAGQEYSFIASDDLNGDGKMDLVLVANVNPNQTALIFLGNGDGTFSSTPLSLPLGANPNLVTIADLNNDGAPDLLVPHVSNNGGVSLLMQTIGPLLHISPSTLSFTSTQGEPGPSPLTLTITNTGDGIEQWSATASQPWVTMSQTSGSVPSSMNVGVNPTGLAPGTYSATVTVTAAGASNSPKTAQVNLTVEPIPIVLQSVALDPTVVRATQTSQGTVNLTAAAGAGGATVSLTSDSPSVQVPLTVVVPAGMASANFSVATSSVPVQKSANITASYNGISTAAALTVKPIKLSGADFDGDGKTDLAIWRPDPSNGTWWAIRSSDGNPSTRIWGVTGDKPVPGDYDGDGKTDFAVWRPDPGAGTWWVVRSSDGGIVSQPWGVTGDIPVPGDYDGDGKTDFAVWRPNANGGTWYVIRSSDGGEMTQTWGVTGDIPVPGDYDGDGKTDFAVWRPSTGTWYVIRSSDGGLMTRTWGVAGDIPVPGDYDGDGKTDFAIWRPSTGTWWVIRSSDGGIETQNWGTAGDIPVPGDYDGDGKTDFAVWRPSNGTWYVTRSSDGVQFSRPWGVSTDIPINKPVGQ